MPSPDTCMGPATFRIANRHLVVPPYRIVKFGQTFINPMELRIDLDSIRAGRYRVIAVQNFHVEDQNPDLNECLAGIFLAAQRTDGTWEEPEAYPIECRTLEILGTVDVAEQEVPTRDHPQ